MQSLFKFCIASIGDLVQWQYQTYDDVTVSFRSQNSGNGISTSYPGRVLEFVPFSDTFPFTYDTFPNWNDSVATFGAQNDFNFNGNDIGWDRVPKSITPYNDPIGLIVYYHLFYDNSANDNDYSLVGNQGSAQTEQSTVTFTSDINSIVISYSTTGDSVCSISFPDITGISTTDCIGAPSNQTFTISAGYGFAGFVTLDDADPSYGYLVMPLQYRLIQSRVASYQNEGSTTSLFNFRIFYPATQLTVQYQILDSRDASGDLEYTSYLVVNNTETNDTIFQIDLLENQSTMGELDRACTSLEITGLGTNTADNNGNARKFEAVNEYQTFYAWTNGYSIVDHTDLQFGDQDDPTVTYITSAHHSETSLPYNASYNNGAACVFDLLQAQQIGMLNGVFYLDGVWLGTDQGDLSDSPTVVNERITSVIVYFNSSHPDEVVIGMQFIGSSGAVADSIGLVSSSDFVVDSRSSSPDGATGGFLGYLWIYTFNDQIRRIEFCWMKPSAPWNIFVKNYADYASSFYNEFFSGVEDDDGDQQIVRFWLPFDTPNSNSVRMLLSGNLGRSDEDQATLYVEGSKFSSSRSFETKLHFLIAQTPYNFTLSGSDSNLGVQSLESTQIQFMTPNAARLNCTVAGSMTYQIEFEGVPDVQSYSKNLDVVFSTPGSTTKSSADVQNLCADDECFHFTANSGFPVVNEFRGYPRTIEVYYITGEGFVRGFRVFYLRADGGVDEFVLAGSFLDDDGVSGYTTEALNLTQVGGSDLIAGFTYSQTDDGRLSGIQFQDASGTNLGDCLGPGNCDTAELSASINLTSVTGEATDYYISGFALTVSTNQVSNRGIYAIEATFTLVDWPTLMSASRTTSCNLAEHLDVFYTRNSAWTYEYDIGANNTGCGTIQAVYNNIDGIAGDVRHRDQDVSDFNHSVVYYQVITREGDVSGSDGGGLPGDSPITRTGQWEATAFCYYNATAHVRSSFGTLTEDAYVRFGTNNFSYALEIATDNSFSNYYAIGQVPTLALNEEVDMRVLLTNAIDTNLYIVITEECWATNTEDPNGITSYTLETGRCPVEDSTWEVVDGPDYGEARFKFNAFAWTDSVSDQVFVHCKVLSCPVSEPDSCAPALCSGDPRARRQVKQISDSSNSKVRQEALVSTAQPILIVKRDTANALRPAPPNQYSPLTVTLAALFTLAALVAMITLTVLYLVKRHQLFKPGGRYQELLHSEDDSKFRI